MPNHVTNIIEFHCSKKVFQEIAEFIRKDDSFFGSVDFNKVLPMPPELDIEAGSRGEQGLKLYKEFLKWKEEQHLTGSQEEVLRDYIQRMEIDPETIELGKQYLDNLLNHGAATWYDWCVDHWGTKWNAYGCVEVDPDAKFLQFNTAWNCPFPVIAELSFNNPEIPIRFSWADEDIGYNVGSMVLLNAATVEENIPEGGSDKAYELAAEVHDFDLAEWGYVFNEKEGTYEYVEENQYVADSPNHSDDAR